MKIALLAFCAAARPDDEEIQRAVVKVFATVSPPNMMRPWEVTAPAKKTGSGVVLEGGRILTNAHVVAHAHEVYVQPHKSPDRLTASVEWLSMDCDLANLKLEIPEDLGGIKPIPLADSLPPLKSKINIMGYPTGGDTISFTEGVVSRIELAAYNYGTAALRIQVDAAVNPGNSGGPGIIEGKVAGIVLSVLKEAENIGYLIPAEVVRHFLDDWTKDGRYDGFPKLDVECDTLENPALRAFLKLERKDTGIVVRRHDRPEIRDVLRPWDVIADCEGISVDNLGMVQIEGGLRVNYMTMISRKPAGAAVRLTIIRDGKRQEVDVATVTRRNSVIQRMAGPRPTYFIYGGLVFTPVTLELINSVNDRYLTILAIHGRKLMHNLRSVRANPDDELVAVSTQILPHRITKGYDIAPLSIVTHVNDVPVRNLRHLIQLLKGAREKDFVVIQFDDNLEERIVLKPGEAEALLPEILRNNNISAAFSDDLKGLWP